LGGIGSSPVVGYGPLGVIGGTPDNIGSNPIHLTSQITSAFSGGWLEINHN